MKAHDCETHHGPIAEDHAHPGGGHAGSGHAGDAHVHRAPTRRALLWCIALTTAMMIAEIAGGLWTGSLMLLSDAAHMASHALALGVSWAALALAARPRDARSHYGLYRAEILGAFLNGLGLLAFTAWIGWEALQRLRDPPAVLGAELTAIAALGLVVNLATAWILGRTGASDLNTRSAFLHMLADTISSVAVLAGGAILWATGRTWIDPALSVLVALVVLVWGLRLLRDAGSVLLELSPAHIEAGSVREAILREVPAVQDVHDLHVWEITSGYVCLTAHLVVNDSRHSEVRPVLAEVRRLVRSRFGIGHSTLEVEEPPRGE